MGRKKKEVEIGTFTIVSKAPKGCKRNVVYTVTYQRSGEPETFNVKMVWLDFRDTPTWAFMDGKEADLLTNEERKEFIEEMFKFRKGGSYRKTHPIAYSEKDKLRQQIKEKEYEIFSLQQEIDKMEDEECKSLCKAYDKIIDKKKLDLVENCLNNMEAETGYSIRRKNFSYNSDPVIVDIKTQLVVGVLKCRKGGWDIYPMDDYDKRAFLKENPDLRKCLKQ